MKILESSSSKNTAVEIAIRRLQDLKNDCEVAIEYLQQDHLHKQATCKMAAQLNNANDLQSALFDDQFELSSVTESEELQPARKMTDEEFEKAWAAIGFHGGGGVYSAEEFMRKFKEAQKLL